MSALIFWLIGIVPSFRSLVGPNVRNAYTGQTLARAHLAQTPDMGQEKTADGQLLLSVSGLGRPLREPSVGLEFGLRRDARVHVGFVESMHAAANALGSIQGDVRLPQEFGRG